MRLTSHCWAPVFYQNERLWAVIPKKTLTHTIELLLKLFCFPGHVLLHCKARGQFQIYFRAHISKNSEVQAEL